jgi:uncharacterized protein YqeY
MTLKEQINADFMTAFKNKEMGKKTFLGIIKGEIQNNESRQIESTDENVMTVLKKMEKSLKLTNTPESMAELEFIKPYLPTLLSEEQIISIIREMKENGLTNVGQIMGEFNKNYKGQVDNKLVATLINRA